MKIRIICVGKLKEKYLVQAVGEYSKRLTRYTSIDMIEIPDEKTPDNVSEALENQIKEIEGKKILKHIKENSYCIALAINGEMLSSEELAEKLENLENQSVGNLSIIIGGSLGLSNEVLSKADYKLSFSKMTFPHQLMRVILLEQLYRSFRIISNHPYHK